MRYTTIVEKDEKGLQMIIRAAQQFEEDRFLEGLNQRCYTDEDIRQTIDQVRIYQSRLNTEARRLALFSETFLVQYATDNNKCFKTAERLFCVLPTFVKKDWLIKQNGKNLCVVRLEKRAEFYTFAN